MSTWYLQWQPNSEIFTEHFFMLGLGRGGQGIQSLTLRNSAGWRWRASKPVVIQSDKGFAENLSSQLLKAFISEKEQSIVWENISGIRWDNEILTVHVFMPILTLTWGISQARPKERTLITLFHEIGIVTVLTAQFKKDTKRIRNLPSITQIVSRRGQSQDWALIN